MGLFMFASPKDAAKIVFDESTTSLMAHSIRAVKKIFSQNQLDLDVRLIPDNHEKGKSILGTGDDAPTSLLSTRCHPIIHARGSVVARIFINPNATRHLARFCVAHEIYHLLQELKTFVESAKAARDRVWPTKDRIISIVQARGMDRETAIATIEGDCNIFARDLCCYHHDFHLKRRDDIVLFPEDLIKGVINIGKLKYS